MADSYNIIINDVLNRAPGSSSLKPKGTNFPPSQPADVGLPAAARLWISRLLGPVAAARPGTPSLGPVAAARPGTPSLGGSCAPNAADSPASSSRAPVLRVPSAASSTWLTAGRCCFLCGWFEAFFRLRWRAVSLVLCVTRKHLQQPHSTNGQNRTWPFCGMMIPWCLHRVHFGFRRCSESPTGRCSLDKDMWENRCSFIAVGF